MAAAARFWKRQQQISPVTTLSTCLHSFSGTSRSSGQARWMGASPTKKRMRAAAAAANESPKAAAASVYRAHFDPVAPISATDSMAAPATAVETDSPEHAPPVPATDETSSYKDSEPDVEDAMRKLGRPLRVAMVGRPNVGKSTLFNLLCGHKAIHSRGGAKHRKSIARSGPSVGATAVAIRDSGSAPAIVSAVPGTTRDWKEGSASLGPMTITLIDTAGLEPTVQVGPSGRGTGETLSNRSGAIGGVGLPILHGSASHGQVDAAGLLDAGVASMRQGLLVGMSGSVADIEAEVRGAAWGQTLQDKGFQAEKLNPEAQSPSSSHGSWAQSLTEASLGPHHDAETRDAVMGVARMAVSSGAALPEDLDASVALQLSGVPVAQRMAEQTASAIRNADAVWVVLDAKDGVTHEDEKLAAWVRQILGAGAGGSSSRVLVVFNKLDAVMGGGGRGRGRGRSKSNAEVYGATAATAASVTSGGSGYFEGSRFVRVMVSDSDVDDGADADWAEDAAVTSASSSSSASSSYQSASSGAGVVDGEWWSSSVSAAERLGLGGSGVAVAAVSAAQRIGVDDLAEHAIAALLESVGREVDHGRDGYTNTSNDNNKAMEGIIGSGHDGEGRVDTAEMTMQERREWLTEHGDVAVAIVGRPNVGKSTLVNRLLGTERLLTGPTAGLTRDSTAVSWEFEGRRVALIDTAGLRRSSRFDWSGSGGGLDSASAAAARAALGGAGVVVLVVDSETGLTRQDAAIAQAITREGRPIVVAANRVDAVPDRSHAMTVIAEQADHAVADARGAAVVGMSALAGVGVESLMPAVMDAHRRWSTRISTAKLNSWFQRLCVTHPPPSGTRRRSARPHEHKGKPTTKQAALRISYVTQVNARPPTFAIFCNKPSLPPSYHRFLIGALREEFDLWGVPIRIRMRNKAGSRTKNNKQPTADSSV